MRCFKLNRAIDDSGVSGTGIVASGVVFDDGTTILHWEVTEVHSTTVYKSSSDMLKIHGHYGHTTLEWEGE